MPEATLEHPSSACGSRVAMPPLHGSGTVPHCLDPSVLPVRSKRQAVPFHPTAVPSGWASSRSQYETVLSNLAVKPSLAALRSLISPCPHLVNLKYLKSSGASVLFPWTRYNLSFLAGKYSVRVIKNQLHLWDVQLREQSRAPDYCHNMSAGFVGVQGRAWMHRRPSERVHTGRSRLPIPFDKAPVGDDFLVVSATRPNDTPRCVGVSSTSFPPSSKYKPLEVHDQPYCSDGPVVRHLNVGGGVVEPVAAHPRHRFPPCGSRRHPIEVDFDDDGGSDIAYHRNPTYNGISAPKDFAAVLVDNSTGLHGVPMGEPPLEDNCSDAAPFSVSSQKEFVRQILEPLSAQEMQRITTSRSLGEASKEEEVSRLFDRGALFVVKRACIERLVSPGWLNDEAINFYLRLLHVRERTLAGACGSRRRHSWFLSTFFYEKLTGVGGYTYPDVRRCSRRSPGTCWCSL